MISYMLIPFCLLIPWGCAAFAKFSRKGYDNRSPRDFLATTEGAGKRANFAQQNFFETYPAFAVGVIAAHQLDASHQLITLFATIYTISRILYAVSYITDKHILRSINWFISIVSIFSLFIIGF